MLDLIPINEKLFLDQCHKKPVRINISLKNCLEDAFYLTLTGRTLVVNNIGGKLEEDNVSRRSDLSYVLQDIFNLSCEKVKGIYTSNITVFFLTI
jgi:arylamine N-acetyltransferase